MPPPTGHCATSLRVLSPPPWSYQSHPGCYDGRPALTFGGTSARHIVGNRASTRECQWKE
eukprot:9480202-Pyramimonas_sp.AAC.1